MRGKSRLKVAVANDMCNSVLVDCKTHFRARFYKLVQHLMGEGADRREASRMTHLAFSGEWNLVQPSTLAEMLREKLLPAHVEKGSVYYDLKKSPQKYRIN